MSESERERESYYGRQREVETGREGNEDDDEKGEKERRRKRRRKK